jgi:flagellar hook-basal body complex protein FliE
MDFKIGAISGLNGNSATENSKINTVDGELSFSQLLKDSISDLNKTQKNSEKAMTDIATGQVKDLHQAALQIDKAELKMKFMLEVRNKALSAYKEISRIQM